MGRDFNRSTDRRPCRPPSAALAVGVVVELRGLTSRRGERGAMIVRNLSGEVVGHRRRQDRLFQVYEKVSEHKTVHFVRGGFPVSV
jgi:hypothetical protein